MSDPTPGSRDSVNEARVRWAVFGLLVALLIAALGGAAFIVMNKGEGGNPIRKVDSLISPEPDPGQQREKVLKAAKSFVERFHTYGPSMLDSNDKMPDYTAVAKLMTAKFATVFEGNACLAEQTVAQTKVERIGEVQAVGISTIDDDSATALAGGIVRTTAPDPATKGERVELAPQRFRYEVSLVRQDGRWLIDDLDDLDDGLPPLGQGSDADTADVCGGGAPAPGESPSGGAPAPGESPSGGADPDGQQGSDQ